MATFRVIIEKIHDIRQHNNADNLELAYILGYQCVVGKGQYNIGDLVAYIPEGSIVPEDILESIGLVGKLSGTKHNRVKMIRLRGESSLGILYPTQIFDNPVGKSFSIIVRGDADIHVMEGDDVSEFLGITKWIPPIPTEMAGEVYNAGQECTISYDVENWKKFPDVIQDGEEVVFTEKLLGANMQFGIMPESLYNDEHYQGKCIVAAKGLGADGLCFKHNETNKNNIYIRAMHQSGLLDIPTDVDKPWWIFGEVIGVQDLKYGLRNGNIDFRVFDVCSGKRGSLTWLNDNELELFCMRFNLKRVPVLYRGPFNKGVMNNYVNGKETVSGTKDCIRGGIVMRPVTERFLEGLGRVQLKYVSDNYLLRKNGTENS